MELRQLLEQARTVKKQYEVLNIRNGHKPWGASEHTQALLGDAGDLMKLMMAKSGFRSYPELDDKIAHELADCLWAILIISDSLDVDLEQAFLKTMEELKGRIAADSAG